MTFNINNQTAGQINNVAGDQHVSGGQHTTVVTLDAARDAVRSLEQALADTPLPAEAAVAARAHTEAIDAEMRTPDPEPASVAEHTRRLTDLLRSTGSLVSAGAALVGPLQTLAGWLGQLGEPILRVLTHAF